ncbi:MAG: DUF3127 domain-containing protein [Pirellulales bacterium]
MSDGKLRGHVHLIEETKTFGQKGFRKRMVVLEQNTGRFTNYIPLEFTNDACNSVDNLNVGDEIEVNYRLTGRKWQRDPQSEVKYFLSAEATGYRPVGGPAGGSAAGSAASANSQFAEADADDDDVPF